MISEIPAGRKSQSRKPRAAQKKSSTKNKIRLTLDLEQIYSRAEISRATGISQTTLIRAYDNQHLDAYRVGRLVFHSGQHLRDWLESGGRTGAKSGTKEEGNGLCG